MRPRPLNNRAFTLLELVVVMMLIALATSLAIPQVANFLYTDQLKASVRKLVGLLARSSLLAQERQQPHLLKYIERERRFVLEPEKRLDLDQSLKKDERRERERTAVERKDNERKDGDLRLTGSVSLRDVWSLYGGTKSVGEIAIRFNAGGYVEPTIIHLREEGGKEISVVLSPFLGRIQVVDSYVSPDKDDVFQ